MDIHQLKIFASVFRNRSFSKASAELYLTQPTVSDHIRALEEDLDCRLFDRLGRTIIPTKEAEALYMHAAEIIEKADQIRGAIGEIKKEVTEELVIGASTIPGTYLMPPLISTFKKKYPSTSFRIVVSDSREIFQRVAMHELLMGIVGAKLTIHQIQYVPFLEDELIAVASPSLVKTGILSLREFLKIPMILREEGSGTRKEVEKILEGEGVTLEDIRIAGIFGSTDAVKQAVKAGLGTSIVSRFAVTDELRFKVLKEITVRNLRMKRNFYVIHHRKRSLPFAYQTFLAHIRHESRKS